MKKTFIKICSIAAIGLALTACNNDEANKKAQDADNASIDQIVQDKVKSLDDSLAKVCDDQVTLAATAKLEAEAPKGGTAHAPAHHNTTSAKPETKTEPKKTTDTKADKMGGSTTPGNGAADKSSKMGGSTAPTTPGKSKADKMGGTK